MRAGLCKYLRYALAKRETMRTYGWTQGQVFAYLPTVTTMAKRNTQPQSDMALFNAYPNGFVYYGEWLRHHIKMRKRYPLGCKAFCEEWLRRWEAVGRLLETTVRFEALMSDGEWLDVGDDARLMDWFDSPRPFGQPTPERLVLLDGTVIREWGRT